MSPAPPADLIRAIHAGRMVVLIDEECEDAEGGLLMAADAVTEQSVNFMVTEARGLVCLAITEARRAQLNLPLMAGNNRLGSCFTVSVEAASGVSTGISAADRARTIRVAVDSDARPSDLVQPGHIFPIAVQEDGVLRRSGFEEAACDLARLAGREPASVVVRILNDAGEVARGAELAAFARLHGLQLGTIADLIHYRILTEQTIRRTHETRIETRHGEFRLCAYEDHHIGAVHLALVLGDPERHRPVLCRVQAVETLRDALLHEPRSGIRSWNIDRALERISAEGEGVLVLLARQESTHDVLNDIARLSKPAELQAPVFAQRSIGIGAQILRDVGVGKIRQMSHPVPYRTVAGFELEVTEFVPYEN